MKYVRKRKLTDEQVREIREKVKIGVPIARLAREYQIHYQTLRLMLARVTYKFVV